MHVFRSRKTQRHGVSLLEVLVSIGVTSVGLLGVLALIPLGGAQARQGQVAERCPVIGLSAFAEIRNRDLISPVLWANADGTPHTFSRNQAVCIDPRYVASGGNLAFPAQSTVAMPRLSLWSGNPAAIMSKPMADLIFKSHDDLQLIVSESDRSMPPSQNWLATTTATAPTRRQAEGTMSWMMTVFPNRALVNVGQVESDEHTVSVVVFNRRVLDASLRNEFTGSVTFTGGGIAGGDILVDFTGVMSIVPTYTPDELREIKTPEGSWVLLGGQVDNLNVFDWYRVIASESTSANMRQMTLAGPDWNLAIQNPQLTVIPGTMAVYQRNVQLDAGNNPSAGASLWRN